MSHILLPSEVISALVGAKTKHLQTLIALGLSVPRFVALSSEEIIKLIDTQGKFISEKIKEIAQEIIQQLPATSYAIRSSALIEDAKEESLAGQFTTKLNITSSEVVNAIIEVLKQAREFLHGDLSKFSLLIQEFIEPDYAGIIFTRNPLGGREFVVEYHAGRGEEVVGGKVKPERIELFWNTIICHFERGQSRVEKSLFRAANKGFLRSLSLGRNDKSELSNLISALETAQKIEQHFQFPQDIEWCIKDGKWFWLQTRPITTLNAIQYQQSLYLDEQLPTDKKFFYQKTEISEIAPRPTSLTFSLLKRIYDDKGPVARVYKKYGITYQSRDFLKIFGNELFIDREEELKAILPSYSFLTSSEFKPKLSTLSGIGTTFKNLFALNSIKTSAVISSEAKAESRNPSLETLKSDSPIQVSSTSTSLRSVRNDNLFSKLKNALEHDEVENDVTKFIQKLLEEYQLIFEINLLAGKAVQKLQTLIKNEPMSVVAILIQGTQIVEPEFFTFSIPSADSWHGNSLEISDESKFVYQQPDFLERKDGSYHVWWSRLSAFKKKMFEKPLYQAVVYNRLREYGRWLIVKKLQHLRKLVFAHAQKEQFIKVQNVYFATLDELETSSVSEAICVSRKQQFDEYKSFTLPITLSSTIQLPHTSKPQGVSKGIAQGILVTREMLDRESESSDTFPVILYASLLSPDLTKYFDRIVGIVSESGGLLSHLAIVAREHHLPVIVNVTIREKGFTIGDEVSVDGETGNIERIFSK